VQALDRVQTHASHLIAFNWNMFLQYVTLWPRPFYQILNGYCKLMMDYTSAKFGDCGLSCYGYITQTDRQTDRQTNADECLTLTTLVCRIELHIGIRQNYVMNWISILVIVNCERNRHLTPTFVINTVICIWVHMCGLPLFLSSLF